MGCKRKIESSVLICPHCKHTRQSYFYRLQLGIMDDTALVRGMMHFALLMKVCILSQSELEKFFGMTAFELHQKLEKENNVEKLLNDWLLGKKCIFGFYHPFKSLSQLCTGKESIICYSIKPLCDHLPLNKILEKKKPDESWITPKRSSFVTLQYNESPGVVFDCSPPQVEAKEKMNKLESPSKIVPAFTPPFVRKKAINEDTDFPRELCELLNCLEI